MVVTLEIPQNSTKIEVKIMKTKIRRNRVFEMILQGSSITDIAANLEVDRKTIYHDKIALQKKILIEIDKHPQEEILANYLIQADRLTREVWISIREADTAQSKLMGLNLMYKINESFLNNMIKLGFLKDISNKSQETEFDRDLAEARKYAAEEMRKKELKDKVDDNESLYRHIPPEQSKGT